MVFELVISFDFSLATIGLALILHSQFFSLEFVSLNFAFGLSIVRLTFLSATLNGYEPEIVD